MYRWHTFSYEWFGTRTRFARGKSQLFIHELLREPLISYSHSSCSCLSELTLQPSCNVTANVSNNIIVEMIPLINPLLSSNP